MASGWLSRVPTSPWRLGSGTVVDIPVPGSPAGRARIRRRTHYTCRRTRFPCPGARSRDDHTLGSHQPPTVGVLAPGAADVDQGNPCGRGCLGRIRIWTCRARPGSSRLAGDKQRLRRGVGVVRRLRVPLRTVIPTVPKLGLGGSRLASAFVTHSGVEPRMTMLVNVASTAGHRIRHQGAVTLIDRCPAGRDRPSINASPRSSYFLTGSSSANSRVLICLIGLLVSP